MDRTFLIACTSFCREAALAWERYSAQNLHIPLTGLPVEAQIETELLVRDEMIAYIQQHGGVTREAGVRRDGRLTIQIQRERGT